MILKNCQNISRSELLLMIPEFREIKENIKIKTKMDITKVETLQDNFFRMIRIKDLVKENMRILIRS